MRKTLRRALIGTFLLALAWWLFVPAGSPALAPPAQARPFIWDQDEVWRSLEAAFVATRDEGCDNASERIDARLAALAADVDWLEAGGFPAVDERLDTLEQDLFEVAPLAAACPGRVSATLDIVNRLRPALKRASRDWDIGDSIARDRVYRILYGARMAVEEILLQHRAGDVPDLILATDVPSETPSVIYNGLRLHSGDILASRGGAPVSALIARGNDYPGNFSHIALLHVSEQQEVSVIEAHIEVGVAVSSLDRYLADKKLRIMVLRLDNELQQVQADPLLPHRAATAALEEARQRHIPYDFAMHYDDPEKKFCSEVASAPYGDLGVKLWEGRTTMSARGTTAWLSALGVEQFTTHGPSDLEYDPKIVVVAEWRDPATLFDDHVDNAVIDALLEAAERGMTIDYDYRYLPLARVTKAYSLLLNALGKAGPVPEGMSATTALRSKWLDEQHAAVKAGVLKQVKLFRAEHDYEPPYWQLVDMAQTIVNKRMGEDA